MTRLTFFRINSIFNRKGDKNDETWKFVFYSWSLCSLKCCS
jgi:hypothetical protein